MELKVARQELSPRSTIGELSVNGEFECFTLEDCVRPVKIKGVTAIPAGTYEVVISFSQRFGKQLPLLLNVPNFDGVRIHPGNTDADTEGCLLVGKTKGQDFIGNSRAAFATLFAKLEDAMRREKVFIEIVQEGEMPRAALSPRGAKSIQRQIGAPGARGRRKGAKPAAKPKAKATPKPKAKAKTKSGAKRALRRR
jgi:Family of unknown function (DUF5675)